MLFVSIRAYHFSEGKGAITLQILNIGWWKYAGALVHMRMNILTKFHHPRSYTFWVTCHTKMLMDVLVKWNAVWLWGLACAFWKVAITPQILSFGEWKPKCCWICWQSFTTLAVKLFELHAIQKKRSTDGHLDGRTDGRASGLQLVKGKPISSKLFHRWIKCTMLTV